MQEGAVPVRPPGHCMSPRRRSGFLAPFLTALGVFALLHAYVARRLFLDTGLPAVLAAAGCVLLALLVVLGPGGFIFRPRGRGGPRAAGCAGGRGLGVARAVGGAGTGGIHLQSTGSWLAQSRLPAPRDRLAGSLGRPADGHRRHGSGTAAL